MSKRKDLLSQTVRELPLPPEWLCIDRYRDPESIRRRLAESRISSKALMIGPVRGHDLTRDVAVEWSDPLVRSYILEQVPEVGAAYVADVLRSSVKDVEQHFNEYQRGSDD